MALTLDPATKLISIPQADLTFVSGTLYELDTDAFRLNVSALLDDEDYIWMPDAYIHNTEVTVAGTTFARTIEFINGYSIQFENTGSAYSVRLTGSNNNLFDIDGGILTPTSQVTVIPTNSGGLIAGSLAAADIQLFFDYVLENSETFAETVRLLRAEAVGKLTVSGSAHTFRDAADSKDRVIATADATGRTPTTIDGS